MPRILSGSRFALAAAVTLGLLIVVSTVACGGDPYKNAVRDIMDQLQSVENEVIGEGDEQSTDANSDEDVSPQQLLIDMIGSKHEQVTTVMAAVVAARDGLAALSPGEELSFVTFHNEYLAALGDYHQALSDYAQVLVYLEASLSLMDEAFVEFREVDGMWADMGDLTGAGWEAADILGAVSATEEAAALLAGIEEDWEEIVPLEEAVDEHQAVGRHFGTLYDHLERVAGLGASAAESGSEADRTELDVVLKFGVDLLATMNTDMDAWFAAVGVPDSEGSARMYDSQVAVDALKDALEEL